MEPPVKQSQKCQVGGIMPKTTITTTDRQVKEIVEGIGIDTLAKRKVVTVLLRQRNVSFRRIGKALGVSCTCVYQYTYPNRVNDSNRVTQLSTVMNGELVVLTGLHKRPYTRTCELCGKKPKGKLSYHHWLEDFPSIGLWVCFKCHMFAESIDDGMDQIEKYKTLKTSITIECLAREESRID